MNRASFLKSLIAAPLAAVMGKKVAPQPDVWVPDPAWADTPHVVWADKPFYFRRAKAARLTAGELQIRDNFIHNTKSPEGINFLSASKDDMAIAAPPVAHRPAGLPPVERVRLASAHPQPVGHHATGYKETSPSNGLCLSSESASTGSKEYPA